LNHDQFAIDFSGEQIPVMISKVEKNNQSKQYSFSSGLSSSVQTHTTRTNTGNIINTTTSNEKYLGIRSQLAPMMVIETLQIAIDSINLTEDYMLGFAASTEKTNLSIKASIWSEK
jgi:hypothetical protein